MDANELLYVIHFLQSDENHCIDRRTLHENYEWLEYFWRSKYKNGDSSVNDFIDDRGKFFWNLDLIKVLAHEFASIECVGSNKSSNYTQSEEIARATMYLRYCCNLFDDDIPSCDSIECRQYKKNKGLCTKQSALKWKNNYDEIFAFKALIYIVRQIRNNLFHGHKMTIEPIQFERNKRLVSLAAQVTGILLEKLAVSDY